MRGTLSKQQGSRINAHRIRQPQHGRELYIDLAALYAPHIGLSGIDDIRDVGLREARAQPRLPQVPTKQLLKPLFGIRKSLRRSPLEPARSRLLVKIALRLLRCCCFLGWPLTHSSR